MQSPIRTFIALACGALLLTACGENPTDRAVTGGAIGAVTGGVIGSTMGVGGAGAVVGGAAGAAIGGMSTPSEVNLGKPVWR